MPYMCDVGDSLPINLALDGGMGFSHLPISPSAQIPNLASWYHLGGGGGQKFVMFLVTYMSL